jgi:hypothetical protein
MLTLRSSTGSKKQNKTPAKETKMPIHVKRDEFKPTLENPEIGVFCSVWRREDVDFVVSTLGGKSLTPEEKDRCLEALVDRLSGQLGMEDLRFIVSLENDPMMKSL